MISGPTGTDGKRLVRAYLEDVFSGGNLAAMDRYLRGDAFMARVAELVTRWRTAFPDFRIELDDVIAEGDRVVAVEILSGTHDGVYESRLGPIAPTGTKVSWSRISIRVFDGDRFVDGFFEEDEVGLLLQLGVLAETGQVPGGRTPLWRRDVARRVRPMTDTRPGPASDEAAPAETAPPSDAAPFVSDPQWRAMLEGTEGDFAAGRRFLRHIPSSPRCKLCAAPFHGPGAPVMKLFDRGPWNKNPTICGFCFKQLERGRGGAEIELSLLFADIRGSTTLGESMEPAAFHRLMSRFYEAMTKVLVAHDGIVDKFVGDEVVALFVPALTGAEHAGRAVAAAREMLKATGHGDEAGPWAPLGIGIHTGVAYVGVVGEAVTDFTALGDAVNVTARLASAAAGGEILISATAAELAGLESDLETRRLTLRGRQQTLDVRVLRG